MSDETNPYLNAMKGKDQHEADMQRSRRTLGLTTLGLFLLLALSIAGNYYQLHQVKITPYIHNVNDLGEQTHVVLQRAADLNLDDPNKKAIVSAYVKEHVSNLRTRMRDKVFVTKVLNIALQQTAGRARGKFQTAFKEEDPFARIKKEGVEVEFNRGQPFHMGNNIWEISWSENVDDDHGMRQRTDVFTGRFQLTEIEKEVKPDNIFGLKVIDREIDLISSKPFYELSKKAP